jgi:hypothetical protein
LPISFQSRFSYLLLCLTTLLFPCHNAQNS